MVVGSIDVELDRPRVVAVDEDGLATGDDRAAGDPAAARREDILAIAARVDEQIGERLVR